MSGRRPEIDTRLADLADAFAAGASALSTHPVLRGGLVKAAMNEAIWALYDAFPDDRHDLADHLDDMGDIVRSQAGNDEAKERDAEAARMIEEATAAAKPAARPGELPLL